MICNTPLTRFVDGSLTGKSDPDRLESLDFPEQSLSMSTKNVNERKKSIFDGKGDIGNEKSVWGFVDKYVDMPRSQSAKGKNDYEKN